tara:strand:+ start:976 stop:1644 length:669 start_codon:yes stop_codon:yes gene_type:complete
MQVICCGSKPYENINFDALVDDCTNIVRHNMLLPNMGYGKKTATYQVINAHIHSFYNQKISQQEWFDIYCDEYGMTEEHIVNFLNYLRDEDPKLVHFPDNNSALMRGLLNRYEIDHPFRTQWFLLKNGLSFIAQVIAEGVKPYAVGYSLKEEELSKHVFNSKAHTKVNKEHRDDLECQLLIDLHNAGLVDASFCALEDSKDMKFNETIEPTQEALKLMEKYL